ncbi:hypothetical protein ACIGBH_22370 [Streptomyces sp. NPDC085929]|uniref:hypothetical protein n=1 Tax=Streptomyces sp. NPDC085929 TaxID=3365739 RepID=UPI0037D2EC87
MEWDRRETLDYGRARGFYVPGPRSLLVEDPARPVVRSAGGGWRWPGSERRSGGRFWWRGRAGGGRRCCG